MIWRSIRHTTYVELTAWAVIALVVLLLSLVGVDPATLDYLVDYSGLGAVLFVGLCLLIYRFRYHRL